MTTRREFIKILTGTVIAISLPVGLFSDGKTKTEETIILSNVEFTLERIEVVPATLEFHWFIRGLAVPKDRRIPPAYFAVRIDDIDKWENDKAFKKEIIEDIKYHVKNYYKKQKKKERVI